MFHFNKGLIGFRFDAIDGLLLNRLRVKRLVNEGELSTTLPSKPHDTQTGLRYLGADTIGVNFSLVSNIRAGKVRVDKLHAKNGWAIGLRSLNGGDRAHFRQIKAKKISAGQRDTVSDEKPTGIYTGCAPNSLPSAIGIQIRDPHPNFRIDNREVDKLKAIGCLASYWER